MKGTTWVDSTLASVNPSQPLCLDDQSLSDWSTGSLVIHLVSSTINVFFAVSLASSGISVFHEPLLAF